MRRTAAIALASLLAATSCRGGDAPSSPVAATTSTTTENVIVSSEQATLAGIEAFRVRYRSTSVLGEPIEVTGIVAEPEGEPPTGGWPIVAFAHGTTGGADTCAPSVNDLSGYGAVIEVAASAGYVVAATDYEGIGGPGEHPYLNGVSAAQSMVDSVRAAVELLDGRASTRWLAVGHSQGGHAALFAAELAPAMAPELTLLGSVAIAPASFLPRFAALEGTPASAFLALAVSGFLAAEPAVDAATVVTEAGEAAVEAARTVCLGELDGVLANNGRADLVQPGATEAGTPFGDYLLANDPGQAATVVPIFVAQGDADTLVVAEATAATVASLCGLGDTVDSRVYPGADHASVLVAAAGDVLAWMADRVADLPVASSC